MRQKISILSLCIIVFALPGCATLKPLVRDIDGWDLTACVEGRDEFKVCKELFLDNQEKILGGKKAIDLLLDRMNTTVMSVEAMEAEEAMETVELLDEGESHENDGC